jgi:hypothetical protein
LERRAASCAALCLTVLGACAQDINPRAASQPATGGAGGSQPPAVAGQLDGGRRDVGRPPDGGRRPDGGRPPDAGRRPDAGGGRDAGGRDFGIISPFGAPCNTPDFVPNTILIPTCGPCHNEKSSNLTALNVIAPGVRSRLGAIAYTCNSRRLVVFEPVLGGYLLDKLNDAPGICGTRMPAVGPALKADEIECIKTWLNATR